MVTSYAIIKDNKVINRIVADTEFVAAYCLEIGASYSTFEGARVGRIHVNGEWTDAPRPVPQVVEKAQAVIALDQAGYLAQVETYMETAPKQHQLAWIHSTKISRASSTMQAVAQVLGLTETQVDDLFITADGIVL